MSLFQCKKIGCGCIENTALTECSHCTFLMNNEFKEAKLVIFNNEHAKSPHPSLARSRRTLEALISYKKVLGIPDDQEFENYCSACCPVWFNGDRYGVGPNPDPKPEMGKWHNVFPRRKFAMDSIRTDRGGNMSYVKDGSPVKFEDGELMEEQTQGDRNEKEDKG